MADTDAGEGMTERQALDPLIARTADHYETVPYVSRPFAISHPARTGAVAHLFGLDAPPVEDARILEIGCAAGGNIIPVAANFPGARVLGIDIGARQIADGQQRIARLGLTNIELRLQSITDLPEADGPFDYIICHGVYSWVPAPVREAILDVCGRRLSPDGIAYVSYNVLPGWRILQPLRDAFRLLIPETRDSQTRTKMARRLMDFMKEATVDGGAYGGIMRGAAERMATYDDDYLFHEYMEPDNEPFAVSDFLADAGKHGLAYLGEGNIDSMIADNLGAEHAARLAKSTASDIASREQMMDVLTGRSFRRTLLVHEARNDRIVRNLTADRVEGLHFVPGRSLRIEREGPSIRIRHESGRMLQSTDPAVGPAMENLIRRFPSSSTLDECAGTLRGEGREAVADGLFRLVMAGMLDVATTPMTCGKGGNAPVANRLARSDAAAGLSVTASTRHDTVTMDPVAMVLIPHLDGTTTRKDMEKLLFDAARAGTISFRINDVVVTEPRPLRETIHRLLPGIIEAIAASGLLDG